MTTSERTELGRLASDLTFENSGFEDSNVESSCDLATKAPQTWVVQDPYSCRSSSKSIEHFSYLIAKRRKPDVSDGMRHSLS